MNRPAASGGVSVPVSSEAQRLMPQSGAGGTERIVFLDLARGLAIFFVVMQHAVIVYAAGGGKHSAPGEVILLLGTVLGAPVFLFIMGVFLGRPNGRTGRGIWRGLKLVGLGYLLNLLRFTLPLSLTGKGVSFAGAPDSPLTLFWMVDILQMAGLSFVVLTLVRAYLPVRWLWVVLASAVSVVFPLLRGRGDSFAVCALLWGTGENVVFPLFPWLVYPLVGMAYSSCLLNAEDYGRAMKRTAAMGGFLFLIGAAVSLLPLRRILGASDYYRSGPGTHLAVVGVVFVWLALCWGLAKRRTRSALRRVLCFWSRHVTTVYFVQWVLIGWGMVLLEANRYSVPVALVIGAMVLLLTHFITVAFVGLAVRGRGNQ